MDGPAVDRCLASTPRLHVAEDTPVPAIEDAFKRFTEREDIAILLINQYVRGQSAGVLASPVAAARAFVCEWWRLCLGGGRPSS